VSDELKEKIENSPFTQKALTPEDVIRIYKLARSAAVLANWRAQGRGPRYFKRNRRIFYLPADVEAYQFSQPVLTIDCVR